MIRDGSEIGGEINEAERRRRSEDAAKWGRAGVAQRRLPEAKLKTACDRSSGERNGPPRTCGAAVLAAKAPEPEPEEEEEIGCDLFD